MVIYGGEVEAEVDAFQACFCKVISGSVMDFTLCLTLTVIRQPINLGEGGGGGGERGGGKVREEEEKGEESEEREEEGGGRDKYDNK